MKLIHPAEECPTCGGNLYRSHRRGPIEAVALRLLLIRAYRCERCGQRFFIPPTVIFEGRRPALRDDPEFEESRTHEAGPVLYRRAR